MKCVVSEVSKTNGDSFTVHDVPGSGFQSPCGSHLVGTSAMPMRNGAAFTALPAMAATGACMQARGRDARSQLSCRGVSVADAA